VRNIFRRHIGAAVSAATEAPVRASVDADLVRTRFNWEWAIDPDNGVDGIDTYWWWARSVRVDPNEVIADDGEGNLWSVPFTTDGADAITFGEPIRVRETFVPVAASEGVVATAMVHRRRQQVIATELERPDKPERNTTAAERPEERSPMDPAVMAALARQHGLDPASATEEQVNAAVIATAEEPETPPAETPADEPVEETPDGGSEEEQPADEPVEPPPAAATAPAAGTVVVDSDRLARLEADAAQRREAERDQALDAALAEGRFAPSRREHYASAWDADPDGTRHLLTASAAEGGLAPDTVPQHLRGTSTVQADAGYDRVRASMGLKARKEN
jgi:hypothetical protein